MGRLSNIIITGDLRVGKSTLVHRVLSALDISVLGLFCEPILKNTFIMGYKLRITGASAPLVFAHQNMRSDKSFGPFGCDPDVFYQAADYLDNFITSSDDIVVIDEIGLIEEENAAYSAAVKRILDSSKPALVVVQLRADYMWRHLNKRQDWQKFEVTLKNRDVLVERISKEVQALCVKNKT
jgi:nucleoside-triphosphatase